jgi:hypothetical protein
LEEPKVAHSFPPNILLSGHYGVRCFDTAVDILAVPSSAVARKTEFLACRGVYNGDAG